ncbi:MAG: hypothetical protein RL095_3530 [Verrucomicrobiota bacterium]|jgi:hypothetical protein
MKSLLAALVLAAAPFLQAEGSASATATATAGVEKPAAPRSRVVLLNPIVLADDEGKVQANTCFPKKLVDRCYTKADLEFLYLEPRIWRNGKVLRGEMNLDRVCEEAKKAGVLRGQGEIVNLIFVSALDGRAQTCGRGKLNGDVCFVCLPEKDNDPDMLEFVVAHEVGHCFGLIHAVDDPLVPDDVPNVQGDGPYAERLGVDGINQHQRDVVLKSPLVQERVKFFSAAAGAKLMLDESWEPYLSSLSPAAVRAFLRRYDIPDEPAAALKAARELFPKELIEFSEEEKQMLRDGITSLEKHGAAKDWGLMHRCPWHFIKVKDSFCGGFPHTRGPAILFSSSALAMMKRSPIHRDNLLAHEKMHVLERFYPERFRQRFAEPVGFTAVPGLNLPAALLPAYLPNPDAMSTFFSFAEDGRDWVPLTLLGQLDKPIMGRDFVGKAYPVLRGADGKITLDSSAGRDFPRSFPALLQRLPAARNCNDHPNETAAYYTAELLSPFKPALDPVLGPALKHFLE